MYLIKFAINKMNFAVRIAKIGDLPVIHNLIRDSFAAMVPFFDPGFPDNTDVWVKQAVEGDLNPSNFETIYISKPNSNYWVIENSESHEVCGCGAIKQSSHYEAELVRMAVSPMYRGQNLGSKIINSLLEFAVSKGFQRIILTTANADSMKFYVKHGFITSNIFEFKMITNSMKVFTMVKYLSERIINSVCIIGGTHGNERIGVQLVDEWNGIKSKEIFRSSFKSIVLLGNPEACKLNQRYKDDDLNRQFILNEDGNLKTENSNTYEYKRALEINQLLGPKLTQIGPSIGDKNAMLPSTPTDFIIDLHSTESDVGVLLMISGEEDCLAYRIAYYIQNLPQFKDIQITCSRGNKDNSYSIDSIAPSGLAIEVGPVCHGTIDQPLMEQSRNIILHILDYLENHNLELIKAKNNLLSTTSISSDDKLIPYQTSPHLIGRTHFPKLSYFKYFGAVEYPDVSSVLIIANKEDVATSATTAAVTKTDTPTSTVITYTNKNDNKNTRK